MTPTPDKSPRLIATPRHGPFPLRAAYEPTARVRAIQARGAGGELTELTAHPIANGSQEPCPLESERRP